MRVAISCANGDSAASSSQCDSRAEVGWGVEANNELHSCNCHSSFPGDFTWFAEPMAHLTP